VCIMCRCSDVYNIEDTCILDVLGDVVSRLCMFVIVRMGLLTFPFSKRAELLEACKQSSAPTHA